MKFLFAGTPDIGAWALRDLADRGRHPELVVSQPDKPAGRGRPCTTPPVVAAAQELRLPCVQTGNINEPEILDQMADTGAEVLVVAAFGQIFREALLERFLCLNIHPSLLPRHRGAAPVRRALLAGDRETGVSIIRLTPALDEGPIAVVRRLQITPRDDHGGLSRALALLGALGIVQTLDGLADGTLTWTEQEGEAGYAAKIRREDRFLDFRVDAARAHDVVRALAPDIGAEARADGMQVKIWRSWPWMSSASLADAASEKGVNGFAPGDLPPAAGEVAGVPGATAAGKHRLFVGCGAGVLELLELQPAGKRRMAVDDFLRGYAGRLPERFASAGTTERPNGRESAGESRGG